MSDDQLFDDEYRNPYWYMRVWWWDGWGVVMFWLWSAVVFLLGMWAG